MASTAAPPPVERAGGARVAAPPPATASVVGPRRHLAWLAGGMVMAFLVPFILADQLDLTRDVYYGVYVAAVVALFVAWAHDTGQSLREMVTRRWRLAAGLGVVFAVVSVFIAINAESGSAHPGGIEFIGALFWRGVVYGAADGLLLSAFPILLVFAALRTSRLRRRAVRGPDLRRRRRLLRGRCTSAKGGMTRRSSIGMRCSRRIRSPGRRCSGSATRRS